MTATPILRIFLSSPGDVDEERQLARDAIAELQREPQFETVKLEAVSWDDPQGRTPLVAQLDPQTAVARGLPLPSQCEVVVGIFWARMGSPLPADKYQKADGSPYLSGTEYELADAFAATPAPDVLLYRRSEEPRWGARDPEWQAKQDQLARLDAYLDSLKAVPRYVDGYASPEALKEPLKRDLRKVLAPRVRTQRPGTIWNVPYLRNPHFTGRDALLDELHAKLTDGRVALTAVRGMGGVGKTQLALEYAYRHAGEFDLVWWLQAEEPATLLEDFAKLAGPLGLAQAGESEIAAVAAAVCRELTRGDGWLLVFDNANEPTEIEPFLPRGGGGRVLITSLNPSWPFASPLDVPTLSREAAVKFLLERTGQHDEPTADALADQLGNLPLALEQAAAYVVETGLALADYLGLFQTRRRELWAEQKPPTGYPATVGTTWTIALDRLRAEEPRAVDLLNLCAFLAPEAIPRRLLTQHHAALPPVLGATVADPLRLNRLLGALRRYSLVEVAGEAFSFHRLVQAAARDALESLDRRHWIETSVALMAAAFPHDRDDPSTWGPSGVLLAHVLAATGHAEETARDIEGVRNLLNAAAGYFERRAELYEAKRVLERARELAAEALGPGHPEVANLVNNLGYILHGLGDLAGAKTAYANALRIDEANFGADHPNVAARVSNMGRVLQDLGDLAGARAAIERALRINEASCGPDHPNVAISINNLGGVLQDLGDLAGARTAFERALRIDEASFGPDHPNVATRVSNLGSVLQTLDDRPGARAAFERALRIDEASFGPDHPKVATRVNNLGSVLRALGDPAGAKAAFERALRIDEASFGADHPNVAIHVSNLGSVLQDLGDLKGARAAFERALRIGEASFGPDHPNLAISVNNLGGVLEALGDLAGARAAFERALAIWECALGPDHPKTRIACDNLEGLDGG